VIVLCTLFAISSALVVYASTVIMQDDFDPAADGSQWSTISGAGESTQCGAIAGNALLFSGSSSRQAITVPLNISNPGAVNFYLRLGTSDTTSFCDAVESGENIYFSYSIDGGTNWTLMATYTVEMFNAADDFIFFSVPIPSAAQTATTQFRWRQTNFSGATYDLWVLDNVQVVTNVSPVAHNDSYNATEDTPLVVNAPGVLGNDSDSDGDSLTVDPPSAVSGPSHGSLSLNANGSFTYTPNLNWSGTDSFTYTASDSTAHSTPATVEIVVSSGNDAPTAEDDCYNTGEDTPLVVAAPGVLANDSDIDGDSLTVDPASAISGPEHGSVTLGADGSLTYTPNADWSGTDSFTYTAYDGAAHSAPATVQIIVSIGNDAPTAQNDSYGTDEDTPLVVAAPGVLDNDSDPESDPLTVDPASALSGPDHGSLILSADGAFTYTPDTDWSGIDSFTYTAYDSTFHSAPAEVQITVSSGNDAPTAQDDTYSTDEDVPLVVDAPGVLGNDSDLDGDALSVDPASAISGPGHGLLTLNANGAFTYQPGAGFFGIDSFTYQITDGNGGVDTATVNLQVAMVNSPDNRVGNDLATMPMNDSTTIDVLANDTDPDGDPLHITNVEPPYHGSVEVRDGKVIYTPTPGYYGEDAFYYTVSDGYGWTGKGRVLVVIWRPVPPCADVGGEPNSVVYASLAAAAVPLEANVYCRVVVQNGVYLRPAGEIGIQSIIDLGVIQAVEVFGLYNNGISTSGLSDVVDICLLGSGHLIYLNAANMPRSPEWLPAWQSGDFTCGTIANAGTVILVP
jgi:VCBS repeat-containing protein